MPLSIATNLASMTAQRSFLNSNSALETAFERLSTGKRVNSASDDAAGLAIGKDLESRVRGLNQAIRNVNDGISMVQIAEGTLDEVTTILQRMRDLAVQASNASLGSTERGYLDAEQAKLATTLGSVIDQAKFNDRDLIGDSTASVISIQSGADAGDLSEITISAMTETVLGVTASAIDLTNATGTEESVDLGLSAYGSSAAATFTLTVGSETYVTSALNFSSGTDAAKQDLLVAALTAATGTTSGQTLAQDLGITVSEKTEGGDITLTYADKENVAEATYSLTVTASGGTTGSASISQGSNTARAAITTIDAALATVASERASLGAFQSQLESTVRNLANVAENTSAAVGRIMDTDYAAETANLTKAQILQQAATSILAQANAQPQAVLSLLQ
jgi:flagellin